MCLSKDVTNVITDQEILSINSQGLPIGPPSPWTPSQTPSPATSTSTIDSTDRRKCPNSRAEAIRARARTSTRSDSSATVLDKARRLGIPDSHIWTLTKTLQWLLKQKAKFGLNKGSGSKEKSRSEKKQLVSPAIKLEDENGLSRPVYKELTSWPVLRFDGKPGSSPFSVPSNTKPRTRNFARRVGIDQAESTLKKKVEKKEVKKIRKSKSSGFCEICNANFAQFEKHLESQQHKDFVDNCSNWSNIDTFSSKLPDLQVLNFYFSETSSQEGSRAHSKEPRANQSVLESTVEQGSLRTPSQRD